MGAGFGLYGRGPSFVLLAYSYRKASQPVYLWKLSFIAAPRVFLSVERSEFIHVSSSK